MVCGEIENLEHMIYKCDSLDAIGLNPELSGTVFFSSDFMSMGSRLTFPGGCHPLTLERFEKSKMAATIGYKYDEVSITL